jgi:hypothetical protein
VALAALTFGTAAASASTFHFFRTPSDQIGCVYQTGPRYLRCDVMYRTRFNGTKQCGEVGDAGQAFAMRPRGGTRLLCASDTVFQPGSRVMRYGTTRRFGPFRCHLSQSGLRCTNRAGHGWFLSRDRQRMF